MDFYASIVQEMLRMGCPVSCSTKSLLTGFFRKALLDLSFCYTEKREFENFRSKIYITAPLVMDCQTPFYVNYATINELREPSLFEAYSALTDDLVDFDAIIPHAFNSSRKDARYVIERNIHIEADYLWYVITYGEYDDLTSAQQGKAHSSWSVNIRSKKNENLVDFIFRLSDAYGAITKGYKTALKSLGVYPYWELLDPPTDDIAGRFNTLKAGSYSKVEWKEINPYEIVGGRAIEHFQEDNIELASKLIKDATGLNFEFVTDGEKKGWEAYIDDPIPFTLCLWYNYHNDNQWRYDIK